MNKDLSQEKRDTLASEFTYQGKKSGMIGGYCEADFPLYYANEEMAELLGYGSVEELAAGIGGRVANTIHPDDMPRVEKDLGGHFYEGMTYETTYRMPRRDGSWFWTVNKGKVIRAEDGRLAILSVCTDMSAFVQRQQELESKNTVSDHLFKNLPGGYVRCGISEGLPFLYIGERFLNMLGWTEEEVRTKFDNKFANMLCPEDLGITKDHVDKILRGGIESPNGDVIYRILGKDGYHWVSDTTVKAELPGGTFLQCIISDVSRFMTEREQREAELERHLKASEERYEIIRALGTVYQDISVIDLKAQAYMLISGRGRSEQYQGHIGPSEEFKDLVLNRIIAPSQHEEAGRFLDFSTAAARLWDKKFITCEFRGRNGAWYLVTLIAKTRDEGGEVTHVLVSARNIDEQKTKELEYQKDLEEGVAEARRANEAKTNFLHRMSHDIRTPLNGIIGLLKIRKRKDGRWEGRYTVGHDPETGKAIIKNVLGKTQAEVKEKLKKAIEENVGIDYGRAKTYTVGSWLEVWMENYAKVKLRPSTFKTSQGFLKNHIKPQIGNIPLAELTSLDLQRFYKHLLDGGRVDRVEAKKKPKGLAPKTVRNIHQMIGSAYNLAMEQKLVTRNPTQGCALPKVEHKEMKTLTADQLSAFFQEAKDSGVYELYYLDLATGLRRGELLGLKWTDVDLDRGVLKIQRAISRQNGKVVEAPLKTNNAYRTLPLSADAIDVLKMQKCKVGNSEWVFPSPTGGPMSPDSVLHMLQRVLKRAGLPRIRFHDLRHPYVKHTTKIFILRLKVLQAQRDPDRRRKTCGAFRLHRKGLKAKLIEPILQ